MEASAILKRDLRDMVGKEGSVKGWKGVLGVEREKEGGRGRRERERVRRETGREIQIKKNGCLRREFVRGRVLGWEVC